MSKTGLIKAGAVLVMIIAALQTPSPHRGWLTYGLLLFGVLNVLLDVPGTMAIRTVAAVIAFAALLWQDNDVAVLATLLVWLIWPPTFMVAWSLGRRPSDNGSTTTVEGNGPGKRARLGLAAIIAAVAIGSIAYRMIVLGGVQQTAALFVGIPALLAVAVVIGVTPRSATGVACKAVTVGLLVSLLLLGEGMLCVAMSAPLFYLVAIVVAKALEVVQARRQRETTLFSCLVLLAFLPMSLEGVFPFTTVKRDETVIRTKVVHASAENVAHALVRTPRFDREVPLYLRAGFPHPILTEIDETSQGTRWRIRFRGGEMRINGMEPRVGDLILVLDEARPGHVRWRAVSDSSHMTHFLQWSEIIAEWSPIDGESSLVTWTIRYERLLDPAWYFGPMERYAVRLAADYLIDSVATP